MGFHERQPGSAGVEIWLSVGKGRERKGRKPGRISSCYILSNRLMRALGAVWYPGVESGTAVPADEASQGAVSL